MRTERIIIAEEHILKMFQELPREAQSRIMYH